MEENENQSTQRDVSEEEKKEIHLLTEYIDELSKRQKWKANLRQQNSDLTKRLDESELRKLDSSLKKVSSYFMLCRKINKRNLICVFYALILTKFIYYVLEHSICPEDKKFQRIGKEKLDR